MSDSTQDDAAPIGGKTADKSSSAVSFSDLGLPGPVLDVLKGLGYEAPTPIQAATIPALLDGRD
ncbi:MAG: DEAD/DEAH box helicase, partial [Pseudomonadota bacterium]